MTTPAPTGAPAPTIEGMDAVHRDALAKNESDSDDDMPASEKLMRQEEASFYSASEQGDGDDNIWGLLSGVGGNIYEWYVCLCVWIGGVAVQRTRVCRMGPLLLLRL